MQVFPAKAKDKNCTGRCSIGLRNQNGKNLVNQTFFETQVIQPELYLLLKVQIAKIKITHHKVVGNDCT